MATPYGLKPDKIVLKFSWRVPTVAVVIFDRRKGLMVSSRIAVRSGIVGINISKRCDYQLRQWINKLE